MMTLKLSSRSRARRKSDFVFAPDLLYSSMSFCWSVGLGILMCHLSHRGQVAHLTSVLFCFIFCLDSLSRLWSDCPPLGARDFVGQMAICGTKTHLAGVKKGRFIASFRSRYFFSARASLGSRRRDLEKLTSRDLDIRLG